MAYPERLSAGRNLYTQRRLTVVPDHGIFFDHSDQEQISGVKLRILQLFAQGKDLHEISQCVGVADEKVKTLLRETRSVLRVNRIANIGGDPGVKTVIEGFKHGYLSHQIIYTGPDEWQRDWSKFGYTHDKKIKPLTPAQFAVMNAMVIDDGRRSATEEIAETTGFTPDDVATHIKGIRYSLKSPNRVNVVSRYLAARQAFVLSVGSLL